YVWGEKGTVSSIPACLALPWHQLARMLERPPVLSYASYALDNWRRLDVQSAIELGNIVLLQNFLGGQDEEWLVVIHVAIEAKAGRSLGSIIPALDAALGIAHAQDMLGSYLKEMRDYMPPRHRAFIETVEAGPSVRDYVLRHRDACPGLRDAYNAAVDGIELFRSTHLEYARNYIVKQSQGGKRNPTDVGTGGTPFVPYLKKHRAETRTHKIGQAKRGSSNLG